MALIKCRECGKEISKSASTCPYCGRPDPQLNEKDYFWSNHPILLFTVGFIIAIPILSIIITIISSIGG